MLSSAGFNPMRDPEKKAKIVAAILSTCLTCVWACGDATLTDAPKTTDGNPPSSEGVDSGPSQVGGDSAAPLKPSGCAEPSIVAPTDLPATGFLAPKTVTLKYSVDGDTAHFIFPDSGEQILRFLWVNTEESHDNSTAFGIETAAIAKRYLTAAKEIVVAVEEDKKKPGSPHVDPYNRWLGLVFVDGDLFQKRLVREGLSAYYTQFGCAPNPVHNALLWSEAEARANERGIWQPGHPTDYSIVLKQWIGSSTCRPNPYKASYCE